MKRLVGVAFGWPVTIFAMAGLSFLLVWNQYWSAGQFYELRRVVVSDAKYQNPVPIAVDRVIHRNFDGRYTVTIRSLPDFASVCSGGSTVNYNPNASPRENPDVEWWAWGAQPPCMSVLVPGEYIMETCVVITPHIPFVFKRRVCAESNAFEVTE